jgi:hypothetical protein
MVPRGHRLQPKRHAQRYHRRASGTGARRPYARGVVASASGAGAQPPLELVHEGRIGRERYRGQHLYVSADAERATEQVRRRLEGERILREPTLEETIEILGEALRGAAEIPSPLEVVRALAAPGVSVESRQVRCVYEAHELTPGKKRRRPPDALATVRSLLQSVQESCGQRRRSLRSVQVTFTTMISAAFRGPTRAISVKFSPDKVFRGAEFANFWKIAERFDNKRMDSNQVSPLRLVRSERMIGLAPSRSFALRTWASLTAKFS